MGLSGFADSHGEHVCYLTPDGHVHQLYFNTSNWADQDLTEAGIINLNVPWQQQQQSNWCWAAVSSMISHYYDPSSTWTQCAVATGTVNEWRKAHNELPVNCCDPSEAPTSDCNVTWGLLPPLQLVSNFGSETGGVESLDGMWGQLRARCPVGIQVAWSGGGGHFLIIDGIDMNTQTLHVEDPAYGPGDYSYNTVATAYQQYGTWVDTFLTIG